MNRAPVIPAQIRAARALLDWSQEQLATAAEIALTSVRDLESGKRAADVGTAKAARQALENEGVEFIAGDVNAGPGVRLVAGRPNIIRRPTTMTMWDGMPFTIEWQGRELTVFVERDVIDDLGHHTGSVPDSVYLKTFEKFCGSILDGVREAVQDPENIDRQGRLRLSSQYIRELR